MDFFVIQHQAVLQLTYQQVLLEQEEYDRAMARQESAAHVSAQQLDTVRKEQAAAALDLGGRKGRASWRRFERLSAASAGGG